MKQLYRLKASGSREHTPLRDSAPWEAVVLAALDCDLDVQAVLAHASTEARELAKLQEAGAALSVVSSPTPAQRPSGLAIAFGLCDLGRLAQCGRDVYLLTEVDHTDLEILWRASSISPPPRARLVSASYVDAEDPVEAWEITPEIGSLDEQGRQVVTLGAIAGNDLVAALPGVSKRHGKITFEGDRAVYSDVASAAGSWVDGIKINSAALSHGSELELAYWPFLVELDPDVLARPPAEPPARTAHRCRAKRFGPTHLATLFGLGELSQLAWLLRRKGGQSETAGRDRAEPQPERARPIRRTWPWASPSSTVGDRPWPPQDIDRAGRSRLLVGRFPTNDIVLDHPAIAKVHLIIEIGESSAEAQFCGAPLEVDGRPVTKSTPLRDGSVIRLGDLSFSFRRPPSNKG